MTDSFAKIILNKIKEEMEIPYNSIIYLLFGFYLISLSLFLYINKNNPNNDLSCVYGLFLIIFAMPLLILNKPSIFQLKRNCLTFIMGIVIEIIGIILCLIPKLITYTSPILLGVILFFGNIALLSKIFLEETKNDPITIEIKLIYSIIYIIGIIIGANNMFKAGLNLNIVILIYSVPFFYLTYRCINYKELKKYTYHNNTNFLLNDIHLETESILALILGVFAIVSGIIMVYFNIISINGLVSIMLLIISIQSFNGITPVGILDRTIWLYSLGFICLILATISCLIPNIITTSLTYLVGFLNICCIFQVVDLSRMLINHYNKVPSFKLTLPVMGMICNILENIIVIIFGVFLINQTLISLPIMGILLIIMGIDILVMIFLNEKNKSKRRVKYF